MGFWYSVLASHMSLRLVPKILDAVDMAFLFDECFRMIDADVVEPRGWLLRSSLYATLVDIN